MMLPALAGMILPVLIASTPVPAVVMLVPGLAVATAIRPVPEDSASIPNS